MAARTAFWCTRARGAFAGLRFAFDLLWLEDVGVAALLCVFAGVAGEPLAEFTRRAATKEAIIALRDIRKRAENSEQLQCRTHIILVQVAQEVRTCLIMRTCLDCSSSVV